MAEDREKKPDIKVIDRRLFDAEGQRREDAPSEPEEVVEEPVAGTEKKPEPDPETPEFERRPVEEPQGVDFTMLVNAMATQALMLLGEIPDPSGQEPEVHLEQARLQIDMLDLIRVKSRGNLTPVEEKLIEEVLYQLRMRCIAKSEPSG